jgi:hypothetical protein
MSNSYASAIEDLTAPGTQKFRTAKRLLEVSQERPAALDPHFDAFCNLLKAENNIIRWTAIQIVANLAAAGKPDRARTILRKYLAPIRGPVMITAANTIAGAARIAAAHPTLAPTVVRAILGAEKARYQTDECRNVAIGHAITALGTLTPEVRRSRAVVAFVQRQAANTRPATRKKAETFLKKI